MRSRRFSFAIDICVLVAWPTVVFAATHHVPSEYTTINAALDAATSGDSVLVAPGTYSDYDVRMIGVFGPFTSVAFLKGGVSLIGEGGREVTWIDLAGQGEGRAVPALAWSPGADRVVVEGFTITGAPRGNPGLWCNCSFRGYLTVRDCRFQDLDGGTTHAGGLESQTADLTLERCEFRRCLSARSGASHPAALYMSSGNTLVEDTEFLECAGASIVGFIATGLPYDGVVRNCAFRNNFGLAAACVGFVNLTVEDCEFVENELGSGGGVSALSVDGAVTNGPGLYELRRNLFAFNSSPASYGGGTAVYWSRAGGTFEQNTLVGNGARSLFLQPEDGHVVTIKQNIFAGTVGSAAVEFQDSFGGPPPISACNDFWNNAAGDTHGYAPAPSDLFVDPLFCGASNAAVYTLATISPCAPPNSGACGQIGAFGVGCGPVALDAQSWGQIKAPYRGNRP